MVGSWTIPPCQQVDGLTGLVDTGDRLGTWTLMIEFNADNAQAAVINGTMTIGARTCSALD